MPTTGFVNLPTWTWGFWSSTNVIPHEQFEASARILAEPGISSQGKRWAGLSGAILWPVRTGFLGAPAPPRRTGQTECYDMENLEMGCAGTGQDGESLAGRPWPNPRFADNRNATVTDNLTGLMWTKMTYSPGPSTCAPYTGKTWLEALDFIKCLNNENYLGFSNWRLPNIRELISLIDFGSVLLELFPTEDSFSFPSATETISPYIAGLQHLQRDMTIGLTWCRFFTE